MLPQFEITNIFYTSIVLYICIFLLYVIVNNFIVKYINNLYEDTNQKILILNKECEKLSTETKLLLTNSDSLQNKLNHMFNQDKLIYIKNYLNSIDTLNEIYKNQFNNKKLDLKKRAINKYQKDNIKKLIENIKINMEENNVNN